MGIDEKRESDRSLFEAEREEAVGVPEIPKVTKLLKIMMIVNHVTEG